MLYAPCSMLHALSSHLVLPFHPHRPLSSLSNHLPRLRIHSQHQAPFMDDTGLVSLLRLPSEILCQIVPLRSRHDLAICVLVCKAWHTAFMDSLWNKVELRDTNRYNIKRPVFDRVKELYRAHFLPRDHKTLSEETVATKSPFLEIYIGSES